MRLYPIPIELNEANLIVANFHRHSKPVRGHKWSVGCSDGEELAGVAIVGRTTARALHDEGFTAEVLRCCVLPAFQADGAKGRVPGGHPAGRPNGDHSASIESFLYAACWRAWRAMGGRRLVTYSLQTESGSSLRGAGFRVVAELKAREDEAWTNRPGREWREVYGQAKLRWEKVA